MNPKLKDYIEFRLDQKCTTITTPSGRCLKTYVYEIYFMGECLGKIVHTPKWHAVSCMTNDKINYIQLDKLEIQELFLERFGNHDYMLKNKIASLIKHVSDLIKSSLKYTLRLTS